MVAQVGNLQVRVGADITGLSTGMRRAQREVAQSAAAMKRSTSDLQLTFKEVATFSSRLFRAGGLIFGGAFGANKLLEMADAAKTLSAQLKLATSQYGSFEQANKDVLGVAERSRSDLLATADLYAALMRNSDQFGATQAQVARVTETVSKAFKISGASADEAANATRQLVQAFQSGRLQGDEFRSMMENAPRLTRLLADSLGKTVGELRNMSKEGTLTADVLVKAFSDKRFTATIDEEFRQLPVTFDQAMSQLYNAALITFSEFDRGGQFSTSIANFVSDGVDGFETLGKSAYHWGEIVSDTFSAVEEIRNELAALHTDGIGAFVGLENATYSWRDALGDTLGILDGVANAFANLANAPGNLIRIATGFGGNPIFNPSNMRGSFIEKTNQKRLDATRQQIMGRTARDMLAEFGLTKAPPAFHPTSTDKKAKKGRTAHAPRDRSADITAQFEREQQQADLDILHAKQQLAGSSEQRASLDVQIIQLEHDIQDAEINERVRKAERDKAEHKITQGALDQVEAQAKILKARNDHKTQLELQALIEERLTKTEQANFEAADQQRKWQTDALHIADQLATTQADHRRIQLQILDSEINQRRLELEHEKDLAKRNGATVEQIKVIQDQIDHLSTERAQGAVGIEQNTKSPLEEWAASVPKTAAEINEALQSIEAQGIDGLADALTGVITGTESLKDAFHQLAASILADLIKMTIKMAIFKALTAAFGGFGGGVSSGGASADGSFSLLGGYAPGFATGGSFSVLGKTGTDRNLLSLNGLPMARVSHGERINIGNDNAPMGGGQLSLTMHNDFRGVDPSSVARVEAKLDQLKAEIPGTVLATMGDARDRFVWRNK